MFWRVRLELTAAYATALVVTLIALGTAAYVVVRRDLDHEINDSIERARAELVVNPFVVSAQGATVGASGEDHNGREVDDSERQAAGTVPSDVFFATTTPAGGVIANPRSVNFEEVHFQELIDRAEHGVNWTDTSGDGHRFRIATTFLPSDGGAGIYLHVGRSIEARDYELRALAATLAAGGLAGLVLSTIGGFWLAGRSLVPVRRSLETQRRFVSDASHELRTPIATIQANNELLARHPGQTIAENGDQVEAIATEAELMAKLVADLLTLARADEGRFEIERKRFDLDLLLQEVARDMEASASLRGISFASDLRPVAVDADRQRIRQLAVILVDNALKYTPAGGSVRLGCRQAGKRAELSVSDTGPGIPREHQQRIFDRFYRMDTGRARGEGGSGLGLAIAKWIAEVHGGRIALDSVPGRGSTFTVRIPVAT